jgi:hypothetical protein
VFRLFIRLKLVILILLLFPVSSLSWFDDTHLAVAKAAGYHKWYLAVGADMTKMKMGSREGHNHYANNAKGTLITPKMVLDQVKKYDQKDPEGHLYGAIVSSLRNYIDSTKKRKYGEYHLGFCSHYVGDLSQPLHNTLYNSYNRRHHSTFDGVVNDKVLDNLDKIRIYPITINSMQDLAKEIARIANISLELGYRIEDEGRVLTKKEAYEQLSHSVSLFKAILKYAKKQSGG